MVIMLPGPLGDWPVHDVDVPGRELIELFPPGFGIAAPGCWGIGCNVAGLPGGT